MTRQRRNRATPNAPTGVAWTRRRLLTTTAAISAGALLAACAARDGGSAAEKVPSATKPTGTITFWHSWNNAAVLPVLQRYLGIFEQQNPGVKVEQSPNSTGRDKVVPAIAAGQPPDTLHLFSALYPFVIPARAVEPLNGWIARDKVDLKQLIEADVKLRTINGQIVALPSYIPPSSRSSRLPSLYPASSPTATSSR